MTNNTCELVVAIVNHGFEEDVMTAARAAGARGGTVFNARGTANADDEVKFLGITLHPNKEIIFILTEQKTKAAIMQAIKEKAGLSTPGAGILFTLPVEAVLGVEF